MSEKFYAVKTGKTPGIYYDWESCKAQVDGFSGAEYKSFKSLSDACKWLGTDDALSSVVTNNSPDTEYTNLSHGPLSAANNKDEHTNLFSDKQIESDPAACILNSLPEGHALAYVDGSFNESSMKFSYGVVFFYAGAQKHISKAFSHSELSSMRNVAGEIMGSAEAIKTAIDLGCEKITIYHDYEGIAKWCAGEWKTNKEWTKKYKAFYDDSVKKIEIEFVKVKAHSKDRFNDLADTLAKNALEK